MHRASGHQARHDAAHGARSPVDTRMNERPATRAPVFRREREVTVATCGTVIHSGPTNLRRGRARSTMILARWTMLRLCGLRAHRAHAPRHARLSLVWRVAPCITGGLLACGARQGASPLQSAPRLPNRRVLGHGVRGTRRVRPVNGRPARSLTPRFRPRRHSYTSCKRCA